MNCCCCVVEKDFCGALLRPMPDRRNLSLSALSLSTQKHSKVKIDKGLREELSDLLYDTSTQHERIPYVSVKEMVTLWIKTHKDGDHA